MSRTRARRAAATVAVAATLPYLALKICWLAGSSIGVTDPDLMGEPTMVGLNAMTFGMEVVGLLLALAFATRPGMRLPAWLVLLPLWVGTGLLAVVVVGAPVVMATAQSSALGGSPIEPWVYLLVYGGFMTQGVSLMTAFALYARERWPDVFTTATALPFTSPTRSLQTVVARGCLLVAVPVGGIRLGSAADGGPVHEGLRGLLAIAGAVAFAALVARRGRGPFWRPLVVAWLGSGSLFAWGLYAMIVTLAQGPLGGGMTGVAALVELFGLLTGLVMGMCGAFLLAERSGVRDLQPPQEPLEGDDREGDRRAADDGHR
ncbi:hypothetical protein ACIBP6_38065 [Nonomuraea terrae]|uniref:hypothetical protein n=1 Tax=Nonomuraea terrae TaxID=2530383 RepID=UPI0037AA873D